MIAFVMTLAIVLVLFGATIFVHELGHFLVARWCGMVVETFSIGFGPALWKRKAGGVTYKIGAFPFGGYVALPQMDPEGGERETKEGDETTKEPLPPVSPWKRIAVSAAGAVGNILLSVALAWVVYWVGKPSAPHERECTIGFVEAGGAAEAAGLAVGDRIVRALDRPVENWMDLMTHLTLGSATQAAMTVVSPDGREREITVPVRAIQGLGIHTLDGAGMISLCRVWRPIPGRSAEKAGVRKDDVIVEFAGTRVYSREHLSHLVGRNVDRDVPMVVLRGGEKVTLSVHPAYDPAEKRPLIGIEWNQVENVDYDKVVHPGPMYQLKAHAGGIFRFLQALVTPKESGAAARQVGGPITILYAYWQMVESSFMMALWFTGFINVNLAILNLLPIPVLDGGHIVFALWEGTTRRPVSPRVLRVVHQVFAFLLIGLFVLLTYRDTLRLIVPSFRRAAPAATEPATTNAAPQAP
ncbi:MAG: RIP metalloprotease RseP [Lentisphaerae bacterium]|nr:RIP metalloprotease RseP [Lentisphaerota bacterium]